MGTPASIVVAFAPAGSGHRVAAEAVARELREAGDDAVAVRLVDAADDCPAWAMRLSDGRLTDSPLGRSAVRLAAPAVQHAARTFAAGLIQLQPAVVICTHPLALTVAARLAAYGRIRARVVSVPTDFDLAGALPRQGVALHCVATDESAERLGAERTTRIDVTGIPVRAQFTMEYDTSAARAHFHLPTDGRVILAIAGSSTPETYGRFKEALAVALPALASLPDTSVVVVAGNDSAFATEMTARSRGFGTRNVHVFEYVEHMAPLIACADLVIAKPAGLVCAECMDSAAPLVVVGPAEHHERANAHALVAAGAAAFAEDPSYLSDLARRVIASPKRLAQMRDATSLLARPFAAADIARHALTLAGIIRPSSADEASA